jgi:Amiloride-sensitive sodium channel
MQFCRKGNFNILENYTNCNECLKVLNEIKIPFEDMFIECRFGNQIINCKESFEESVFGTYNGRSLCYTFNAMQIFRNTGSRPDITDEWSIDDGYKSTTSLDSYPRRASRAGQKFGLSVLVRSKDSDYDNHCTNYPATMVK